MTLRRPSSRPYTEYISMDRLKSPRTSMDILKNWCVVETPDYLYEKHEPRKKRSAEEHSPRSFGIREYCLLQWSTRFPGHMFNKILEENGRGWLWTSLVCVRKTLIRSHATSDATSCATPFAKFRGQVYFLHPEMLLNHGMKYLKKTLKTKYRWSDS